MDEDRVYVGGLSAGGAMAAIMAATHPELYAAAGVHSGTPVPSGTVPLVVFHWASDSTVAPVNARPIIDGRLAGHPAGTITTRTEPGGSAARPYVRTAYTDTVDGTLIAESWLVEGARHAWFGGNSTGTYTDPQAPNASAEMARFFPGHRRRN